MVDAAISVANQYGISPGQTMGNVAAGNPEPRLVKKAISGNSMAFLGFLAVGVVGFLVLAR